MKGIRKHVIPSRLQSAELIAARRASSIFADYSLSLIELRGDALPEPYRTLLDHGEHMTKVLEDLNGGHLQLMVKERFHQLDNYARAITLAGQ
jgi:hypothetical protein